MNEESSKVGCEDYLYRDTDQRCCLHPCPIRDCPEPVCMLDIHGGIRVYAQYVEVQKLLNKGMTIDQVAIEIGISKQSVLRRLKRVVVA